MKKRNILNLLFAATLLTACGDSTDTEDQQVEALNSAEETTETVVEEPAEEEEVVDEPTEQEEEFEDEEVNQIVGSMDTSDISGLYHLEYGPEDINTDFQVEYYVNIKDDGTFNYLGISTELDDGRDNYQGANIHTSQRGRGTYVNQNDEVVVMDPPFLYHALIGAGDISGEFGGYTLNNIEYATVYDNESSNPFFGKDTNGEPTIFINQLSTDKINTFYHETDGSLFSYTQNNELVYDTHDLAFEPIDAIENPKYRELMATSPSQYLNDLKVEASKVDSAYNSNNHKYTIHSPSDLIQLFRYEDNNGAIPLEIHEPREYQGYYTEDNYEVQPKFVVSLGQPLISSGMDSWDYQNVTTYAFDETENAVYTLNEASGNKQAHIVQ